MKHKKYTIEEKNNIVKEYLNSNKEYSTLVRKYDIASNSVLHKLIKQFREDGTVKDNRGKSSNGKGNFNKKTNSYMYSFIYLLIYIN